MWRARVRIEQLDPARSRRAPWNLTISATTNGSKNELGRDLRRFSWSGVHDSGRIIHTVHHEPFLSPEVWVTASDGVDGAFEDVALSPPQQDVVTSSDTRGSV